MLGVVLLARSVLPFMPTDDGPAAIPTESVGSPDATEKPRDQPATTPEVSQQPETPPIEPTATFHLIQCGR